VIGWRWPNFKPEEVLSPEGLKMLSSGILLIQLELLDKLELFRQQLGQPLLVNHNGLQYRGYRSPHENYNIVKGEKYSFHMQGLAADISCPKMRISDLRNKAMSFGFHAVGYYPNRLFIHVDLRPRLDNHQVTWTR